MEYTLLLIAAVALLTTPSVHGAGKLPGNYRLCKKNNPKLDECLHEAVQKALGDLAAGISGLGVLSIDPLEVSFIEIRQGSGPISLNLKFRNVKVHGLSKAVVGTVKSDLAKHELHFEGVGPKLIFEADYEMDGKILVLPVTGKGRSKIIFTDMKSRLGPKGSLLKKDRETYFDVKEFPTDVFSLGGLTVHFENLFNGDRTLGESMNQLLNENWKDFWADLRPSFELTFGQVFKEYSIRIFSKVPYDDIFLN